MIVLIIAIISFLIILLYFIALLITREDIFDGDIGLFVVILITSLMILIGANYDISDNYISIIKERKMIYNEIKHKNIIGKKLMNRIKKVNDKLLEIQIERHLFFYKYIGFVLFYPEDILKMKPIFVNKGKNEKEE